MLQTPVYHSDIIYSKNQITQKNCKEMPVDFGPRCAIALWATSLICQVLFSMGIINVGFLFIWSLATIVDKTLKLIDPEDEVAFHEWAGNVWESLFARQPRNSAGPPSE